MVPEFGLARVCSRHGRAYVRALILSSATMSEVDNLEGSFSLNGLQLSEVFSVLVVAVLFPKFQNAA